MKIRIKGNSVRFRLTRSEVAALGNSGLVEERTAFADTVFYYAVAITENNELHAAFLDNKITLFLPKTLATTWHGNDTVGFEHFMVLESGEKLHLLVEKDFVCLDNTVEDQSDNYPNPKANV